MQAKFGDCVFDTDRRLLLRAGEPVRLTPKAFQLLELLLEARPKAVAKQEVLSRLWADVVVTEGSLANLVSELRMAIGDDAREPRFVRTVYGFGYAFAAAVVELGEKARERPPILVLSRYRLIGLSREYLLDEGECLIGRAPDCQVRLESSTVSRHHARLWVEGEAASLQDLGSKNGTFVAEQPVVGTTRVADGDPIRLGSVSLVFRVGGNESSTTSYALRLKA